MKTIFPVFSAFVGLFLVGCMPVERFWWSPDGGRAVVILDRAPYLVDAEGGILEKLPMEGAEATETLVDGIEWLPDGKRFVAHRIHAFEKWAEARPNLPEAEVKQIEQLAKGIPDILSATILVGGDSKRPNALLERISGAHPDFLRNAFFLALETHPEETRKALESAPESLAALEKEREEFEQFLVHEIVIVDVSGDGAGEQEVIFGTSETIQAPVMSPQGTAVAFSKKQGSSNLFSIEVCRIGGDEPVAVVEGAHDSIAWTDDGRSIIFMVPAANEGILKQIKKVTVFDDSGKPLDQKSRQTQNLAAAVVPFAPRIERLPGDAILFASQSVSLPVASSETPYEANLYRVSVDGGSIEKIPTSPGALPMNLGFFIVSPDGERVAVVESDTDAVAVVEIETGRTELVSPAHDGWRCRTSPSWKSDDELTFAALDPSSGKVRWKLWRRGENDKILGKDWPEGATADWLEKKKEDER